MSTQTNAALAPRIPFWDFATKLCGINGLDSKIQLTAGQRAIWKSYDRQVALTGEEADAYREMAQKDPWEVGDKAPPFFLMTLTRGGGKSLLLATIAVYEGITNPYRAAPGETVAVVALAPRVKQSKDLFRYARAHLERPELAPFVKRATAEELCLSNERFLRVQAVDTSGGAARGPTYIACLFDESAFLSCDGKVVDADQWRAILAGARGVEEFRGVLSSTPNGQTGFFFETFNENHGRRDAAWEVFLGPQPIVRPSMDPALLREYQRADEEAFKREFLVDFTAGTGVEKFFNRNQVEGCIETGVIEVPPGSAVASYSAAVDPSGGSNDCFTVCIVERLEDGSVRQCLARDWNPKVTTFAVHDVAREIAGLLAPYGIRTVYGDVFGGQWVSEAFAAVGLEYETRGFNGGQKVQRASCLRELFTTGRIRLLDIAKQTKELSEYERKTLSSGQVSVNHPNTKEGSDDYLDSLGLAVWELVGHITELHPPESLLARQKFYDGFTGKEYPSVYSGFTAGRKWISETEIAEKGKNAEWLVSNLFKDWRWASCSIGEIAWLSGTLPKHLLVHFGRDLILQHSWMRWILATCKRPEYFDENAIGISRIPEEVYLDLDFPGIPAFRDIIQRIVANKMDSRPFVQFGFASEPRDIKNYISSPWPPDLLVRAAVRIRGNEPPSRFPACVPWALPDPKWRLTKPGHPLHKRLSDRRGVLPWAAKIEELFKRAGYEREERLEAMQRAKEVRTYRKKTGKREAEIGIVNTAPHIFGSGY